MQVVRVEKTYEKKADEIFAYWTNFGEIHRFNPNVESSPLQSDLKTGVGAERVCHFYNGDSVREVIESQDKEKKFLKINIVDTGKMPLKSAYVEIKVRPLGPGKSKLTFDMFFVPKMGPLGIIMAKVMMKPMMSKMLYQMLVGLDDHIKTGRDIGKGGKILKTANA